MTTAGLHNRAITACAVLATAIAISGCSLGEGDGLTGLDQGSGSKDFARGTGSPALATKNTIRIPGGDPVGSAAGAALTVYPATDAKTRPKAVAVVGKSDWRAAIAMGVLSARPLGAPLLLSKDDGVPDITESAFTALNPPGTRIPGLLLKPQAIVAGKIDVPEGVSRVNLVNDTYERLALSIDALWTKIRGGKPSSTVIVTSADPAYSRYSLPAGPLAAKTGSPVFFVHRDVVPLATLRAIAAHKKPDIYVVGPPRVISDALVKRLKRFGRVHRVGGPTPVENAAAVATYSDPATAWGWGIVNPGHGMVVMNSKREMDVAASTTLSVGAAFGPLLLNSTPNSLDKALENFLLDIQPGYIDDPTNGVYNRAWLLGDESVLSPIVQAKIDALCEILPITAETSDVAPLPTAD